MIRIPRQNYLKILKKSKKVDFVYLPKFNDIYKDKKKNLCIPPELSFGIKGTALAWFKSYLEFRKQSVQVGSASSDPAILKFGVPQGSVLGPILFTLYTTPLSNIFNTYNINYHLYADDSQLYKGSQLNDLHRIKEQNEQCIEDVKIWMDSNKLKLNNDKTELIIFKNRHQIKDHINESICINDIEIQPSCKIKNLGVIFDEHLEFDEHCKLLAQAGTRALGAIVSKLRYNEDIQYETFTRCFNSNVNPVTDYGSEVWGYRKESCTDTIQLKAIRSYLGVHKHAPNLAILGDMGWTPSIIRRKLNLLRYWNRLIKLEDHRLTKHVFISDYHNEATWCKNVKNIFHELEMSDLYESLSICDHDVCSKLLMENYCTH